VKLLKPSEKLGVIKSARRRMERFHRQHQGDGQNIEAMCLWWAHFTVGALADIGVRALIQAGSAYWPRIPPEMDDGVTDNVFGYEFTPGPHNADIVIKGMMPEIHVWAGIPLTNEIIDLTSGFFPKQAKKLGGFDWPGPKPPSALWVKGTELPPGVLYRPNLEAIAVANACIQGFHTGVYILPYKPPEETNHGTTPDKG
jgi:hypothetical protein